MTIDPNLLRDLRIEVSIAVTHKGNSKAYYDHETLARCSENETVASCWTEGVLDEVSASVLRVLEKTRRRVPWAIEAYKSRRKAEESDSE